MIKLCTNYQNVCKIEQSVAEYYNDLKNENLGVICHLHLIGSGF